MPARTGKGGRTTTIGICGINWNKGNNGISKNKRIISKIPFLGEEGRFYLWDTSSKAFATNRRELNVSGSGLYWPKGPRYGNVPMVKRGFKGPLIGQGDTFRDKVCVSSKLNGAIFITPYLTRVYEKSTILRKISRFRHINSGHGLIIRSVGIIYILFFIVKTLSVLP